MAPWVLPANVKQQVEAQLPEPINWTRWADGGVLAVLKACLQLVLCVVVFVFGSSVYQL